MPLVTTQPVVLLPSLGGASRNAINSIADPAAKGALAALQIEVDAIVQALRQDFFINDPIQITGPTGALLAQLGSMVDPSNNQSYQGIWTSASIFVGGSGPATAFLTVNPVGEIIISDVGTLIQAVLNYEGLELVDAGGITYAAFSNVGANNVITMISPGHINEFNAQVSDTSLMLTLKGLPSTNPGAGSNQIWYDPADSNRVKFAP